MVMMTETTAGSATFHRGENRLMKISRKSTELKRNDSSTTIITSSSIDVNLLLLIPSMNDSSIDADSHANSPKNYNKFSSRNSSFLLVILVLSSICFPSCLAATAAATTAASSGNQNTGILQLIGLYPSESTSSYGPQLFSAMSLAVSKANADPTILENFVIRLLPATFESGENQAWGSLNSVCSLLYSQQIFAVIGLENTDAATTMSTCFKKLQIPLMSHWASSGTLSDKTRFPYFFRSVKPSTAQAAAQVTLLKSLKLTRVALLYTDDDYGSMGAAAFEKAAVDGITIITSQSVTSRTGDASVALAAIKRKAALVIVFWSISTQVVHILEQAVALGMTGNPFVWIASDSATTSSLYTNNDALSSNMVGMLATVPGIPEDSAAIQTFKQSWKTQYPATYPGDSAVLPQHLYAYDAVMAVLRAADRIYSDTGSVPSLGPGDCFQAIPYSSGPAIQFALSSLASFTGLTGTIAFDQTQDRTEMNITVMNMQAVTLTKGTFINVGNVYSSLPQKFELRKTIEWSGRTKVAPSDLNVNKTVLRVVTKEKAPLVIVSPTLANPYGGLAIQMLYEIIRQASALAGGGGYSIAIEQVASYTTVDEMLGKVASGYYDLAIGNITASATRFNSVDMTIPYLSFGLRLLIRDPAERIRLEWFGIGRAFDSPLWAAFLCGVVMFVGAIVAIEFHSASAPAFTLGGGGGGGGDRMSVESSATQREISPEEQRARAIRVFWAALGVIVHENERERDGIKFRTVSAKFLAWGLRIFLVFFAAMFLANTITFLVDDMQRPQIRSLQDIIDGVVAADRVGIVPGSFAQQWLSQNPSLGAPSSQFALIPTVEELASRVLEGSLDVGIHSAPDLEYVVASGNCNLRVVGDEFGIHGYHIAVNRGTGLLSVLSAAIQNAKEQDGFGYSAYRTSFDGGASCKTSNIIPPFDQTSYASAFTVKNLSGPLILAAAMFVFGSLIHIVEIIMNRRRMAQIRDQQPGVNRLAKVRPSDDEDGDDWMNNGLQNPAGNSSSTTIPTTGALGANGAQKTAAALAAMQKASMQQQQQQQIQPNYSPATARTVGAGGGGGGGLASNPQALLFAAQMAKVVGNRRTAAHLQAQRRDDVDNLDDIPLS